MMDKHYDVAPPDITKLFRLDGQIALVTGGGGGIGCMGARVLAQAGAHVIATDLDGESAQETAQAIRSDGGSADAFAMDVSDEASIVDVFAKSRAQCGPVGVLFNNAGISLKAPTESLSLADWQKVVDVNLTGVFLCAREAGKHMLERGDGSIVNVSSIWGHTGGGFTPNLSYHATKGAVLSLTRALAVEWGPRGIRVNDIAPTFLKTRITEPLFADRELHQSLVDLTPLGRTGEPNDLAGALLYLASPASALVNGHSLRVDGGWTAR